MASDYYTLPEKYAKEITCTICSRYLSVPPVKSSVDGTKHQCGRCDFDVADINVINFTYAKLAQYIKFPCIHEGCTTNLSWKSTKMHEMACKFRKIKCPKLDCEHMLKTIEIASHFEELHKDLVSSNMVALIWKLGDARGYSFGILFNNEMPYIYQISHDPDILKVSVYSLRSTDNEKYKLNLTTPTGIEVSHIGTIVPYDDRRHCIGCLMETCSSQSHKYSTNYGEKYELTTELEAKSIKSLLKADVICCEVQIETVEKTKKFDNSNIIRKTIECPICNIFMLPPIYNCGTGHAICNSCKDNLSECPTCKAGFIESRNYMVEELSENVTLPCENNDKGCKFIGNPKMLKTHEDMCRLAKK